MRALRVLLVGPTGPDELAENLHDVLLREGHDARLAGPPRRLRGPRRLRNAQAVAASYLTRVDEVAQRHLVAAARDYAPDLVLSVDVALRGALVTALRAATGAPVVLWYPDAVANLGNHAAFVAGYDRMFLTIPPVVEQLRDLQGLPVRYLPEAANEARHRPLVDYGTERVVLMAGNVHPTRAVLLERLLDDGVPLRLHGPPISGWIPAPRLRRLHSGAPVVGEEKARAFRSARAVLNNLHPAELAGANCRLFEATACGAAVLTEWRPGMEDLFVPDREVLRFATYPELLGLCRRLLDDPEAGRPVADAAAARAASDHLYSHRLAVLLDEVGLS